MRSFLSAPLVLLASMATMLSPAQAGDTKMLVSNSLSTCQDDSSFSASLFNVVFFPGNSTAKVNLVATSSIQGKIVIDAKVYAYGLEIIHQKIDPCSLNLPGLCPMTAGKLSIPFSQKIEGDAIKNIPGIAYVIPDLDVKVRVHVNLTSTGESVACVEAGVSNGKTVDLTGVKWATAIIAGLALLSSAIVNGLGQYNTAAHVAANSLSLFGYFQAQAIVGLTAVKLPPIVSSWTQDFQWSMGIIRVGFMQDIFTWYQRATGGKPSTIFDTLRTLSVSVQKRSLDVADAGVNMFKRGLAMAPRATHELAKRNNVQTSSGSYVVFGIQRVAFRAKIESTNLFMTGLIFFCIFVIGTVLAVAAFKGICELLAKKGTMKADRFLEFRNGWLTVLKGILYRVALIGFPQIAILCLWEFTQADSPAEVVLAVFFLFSLAATLVWGCLKVIRVARRSVAMHRNPAYILFSDPQTLNKWGFLYMQFRASAYYFVAPVLGYTLIKAMFVAFAQRSPIAQSVGFVVVEAAALIAASVMRPWMDKPTNSFNIAICVVNFLNAIFLLIFSDVFGAPPIVIGVIGVVLFILNAVFSLVLLIMVIVSTCFSFFRKNPDARYQYMADDRASFMKSQTQLNTTTELDALAATARGDKNGGYSSKLDLDDDHEDPFASPRNMSQQSFHTGPQGSNRSPVNPSMPLFPANGQRPQSPFRSASPAAHSQSASSLGPQRGQNASPASGYRGQNNSSPWQRGAGYDH